MVFQREREVEDLGVEERKKKKKKEEQGFEGCGCI